MTSRMLVRRALPLVLSLVAGASLCGATPYWIAWEGNDYPENEGWTRYWVNSDGVYGGPGATRTLENGILTIDTLFDRFLSDYYEMVRPGAIDPDAGESFVVEWRLLVEEVNGPLGADPALAVFADSSWGLGFEFGVNGLTTAFTPWEFVPYTPGAFHVFRLLSQDMRQYDLYIDSALAYQGTFKDVFTESTVSWGDGIQGEASCAQWDYFRFGVVPEPSCAIIFACLGMFCCGRRHP